MNDERCATMMSIKKQSVLSTFAVLCLSLLLIGCGKLDQSTTGPGHNEWSWINGSYMNDQSGVYGVISVPTDTTIPGAREWAVSWVDKNGNFWLFGGYGLDSAGMLGGLNDLWKFDGIKWTWISGNSFVNQPGVYNVIGVPTDTTIPGSREEAISWLDKNGNFWLFGGYGLDSTGTGTPGELNDLWKFDGNNWTWVSGASVAGQPGEYNVISVPTGTTTPGGRQGAVSWLDKNGNFWLFGGYGLDSTGTGTPGELNDLWKFDGSNWTWVSGASVAGQSGVYNVISVPTDTTVPGARSDAVSWVDKNGNFWLFGGYGLDSAGTFGILNDLWKFDGSTWTWVSGASFVSQPGVYNMISVPTDSTTPGARGDAVSWADKNGNFWLFGGYGWDSTGTLGDLNDLWKFDGSNWTWINGETVVNQAGLYGLQNTIAPGFMPGAREGALSWVDNTGNFWFFGGLGYDGQDPTTYGYLNDAWVYLP